MSATRTWMLARLTGALVPQERAELELDAYRDEVRVEDAAEIAALRAQVAELLVERHSTNTALSDAAESLRAQRDRISELESAAEQAQALHVKFPDSPHCQRDGEQWPCSTVTHLQRPGGLAEQRHLLDGLDHALEALAPRSAARPTCHCDKPDADPYACEAEPEDCTGYHSELNPFSGSRPVSERSAEVSRTCSTCSWRTSVWHVDDGSADEELHRHMSRAHSPTNQQRDITTIETSGSAL
ncbi:hypothetical protein [Streptomyces sp. NPDC056549]|uniref:hypothetical protein n=1 Tax=Streptomyces sp. NPDC056549 TaxID=3345864 RepID=UPI00367A37A9